jgi:aminopeptidase N
MYQTLLGRDGFRKGMDLYFKRHDGQAVTCDEFVAAMADANQRDLTQFKNWYSQAGTPRVTVLENYDAKKKEYRLTLRQHCPKTPGQNKKAPFHIPLKASLLLDKGSKVSQKERAYFAQEVLLELTQAEQSWLVQNISAKPVLSINRDFSAPIILEHKQSEDELLTLLAEDTDPFSRWESAQKLAQQMILAGRLPNTKLIDAYRVILQDPHLDPAFKELIFTLPAETYLYEQCKVVEPQEIHWARRRFKTALAQALQDEWALTYVDHQSPGPYRADAKSMGKRALKNLALMMLLESGDVHWQERAEEQYELANNMSDRFAALQALVAVNAPHAKNALADFYQRFAEDALVIDKWFALQATRPAQIGTSILMDVKALMQHSAFKLNNPNRVRSLIHAFCLNNPAGFHQADGSAYRFWIECVIALDKINPQVAARLARALDRWPKFAKPYSKHMLAALHHVAKAGHLSPDVGEVITKAIAARL